MRTIDASRRTGRSGRSGRHRFTVLSIGFQSLLVGGALVLAATATSRPPVPTRVDAPEPMVAFVSLAEPSGPAGGEVPEGVPMPPLPEEAIEPEPLVPEPPPRPELVPPPDVLPPDPFATPSADRPAPRRVVRMSTALTNREETSGRSRPGVPGGARTGAGGGPGTAGPLVPISTVDVAPVPVHRVKPAYSDALREARASGTVTARLLIDVDGTVKVVEIREDLGLDSGALARAAFLVFRFRPARRDGVAVAVWIVHRIRFEFQE